MSMTANDENNNNAEIINILLDTWEEISGRRISPDDDFFSFGMDSITLTRFHERILELTDNDIDVSDYYYCTTLIDIAGLL